MGYTPPSGGATPAQIWAYATRTLTDFYYGRSSQTLAQNATERSTTSGSYVLLKQMTTLWSKTFTTSFQLKSGQVGQYAYGRVYKNNVAFGTERSNNTTSYVIFIEDLAFAVGDLYQIYGYGSGGYSCLVQEQIIRGCIVADYNPNY